MFIILLISFKYFSPVSNRGTGPCMQSVTESARCQRAAVSCAAVWCAYHRTSPTQPGNGPVHSAYNPSFLVCFFNRNSIFLSQWISQQTACLSAEPNGSNDWTGANSTCRSRSRTMLWSVVATGKRVVTTLCHLVIIIGLKWKSRLS
jgi:hypothetical protein